MRYKTTGKFSAFAFLIAMLIFALTGCSSGEAGRPMSESVEETKQESTISSDVEIGSSPEETTKEDIIILFTGNAHAAGREGLGYAGVAAIKKYFQEAYSYVTLVDCGNHVQGTNLAAVSNGQDPVEIMNQAGYDYAVPGSQEFGYGLESLHDNLVNAKFRYLCCNVTYTGTGTSPLFSLEPFEILDCGGTKVALVGVTFPWKSASPDPEYLKENGKKVLDFYAETPQEFYQTVQDAVDECRRQGAAVVILLAGAGETAESEEYSTESLIAHTEGVDAVLDGGSHKLLPEQYPENKNGEKVILSSAGTDLQAVGRLVITANGGISTTAITAFPDRDKETSACIDRIEADYQKEMQTVIGTSAYDLKTTDDAGNLMAGARETNLGDLCADALRAYFGAGIGLRNSDSIGAEIPVGDITRESVRNAQPDSSCTVQIRTTGEHILQALEMSVRETKKSYADSEGNPVGASRGFLQVSGIRFTVDTSVKTGVVTDDEDNFTELSGTPRVYNVKVEQEDGTWADLDPEQEYTVALPAGIALEGKYGFTMFLEDEVLAEGPADFFLLEQYIKEDLGGAIPEEYQKVQGRIKVR